jgi:hypothetical protein
MQTTTDSKAMRVEPRPALIQRARPSRSARKPSPSGLSRAELRRLVREMIG